MPHFVYIGRHKDDDTKHDGNPVAGITVRGVPFIKEQVTQVDDPVVAALLAGNPYFRTAASPADITNASSVNALLADAKPARAKPKAVPTAATA